MVFSLTLGCISSLDPQRAPSTSISFNLHCSFFHSKFTNVLLRSKRKGWVVSLGRESHDNLSSKTRTLSNGRDILARARVPSYKRKERVSQTLIFILFSPISLPTAAPHEFRLFPPLNLKNTSKPLPHALNGTLESFGKEKATMEVEGDGALCGSMELTQPKVVAVALRMLAEERISCAERVLDVAFSGHEEGSSSEAGGRNTAKTDPYYSPSLQPSRLTKFQGRKLAYVRYVDVSWLVEQGFHFLHQLEVQGTNTFVELNGKLYHSLIREFYSNFQFKDGVYITMVWGKVIVLDEDLFLAIGGLSCSGSPLGDYENEQWESFNVVDMYKSCLCGPHYFVSVKKNLPNQPGGLDRNTNHAQPAIHDLKLLFAIQEGILVNRPAEILKTIVDLDLSDEENPATQPEQPTTHAEASQAPQAHPFGLAHLDAMEQRLNQRIDAGFQVMNDKMDFGLMSLYDRVAADIQREAK
ncbi:hypothetical protein Lal_00042680 [Lupinus albus]|nr:hypothetical protein Lal_00042680 [Lupinus albus]